MKAALPRPMILMALSALGVAIALMALSPGLASANSLAPKADRAEKKAKTACAKVRKAKGSARKAKARKNCRQAKKVARKARTRANAAYFDVCKKGCKYRTIHEGAMAAGKWQNGTRETATVRIQPGTYNEGVLLHGKKAGHDFDGLTIMGVTKAKKPNKSSRAVILEGEGASTIVSGNPGWQEGDATSVPANNAIEGRSIKGLVMKNMWARNYSNNTFFVWASTNQAFNERCEDYVMENLTSSDTRSYGLFARNCYGGKMLNSEGWNHGDSALYIGETPCDRDDWNNRNPANGPCQAKPKWTLIKNIKSYQGSLGYSGTNSKYVKITDSLFYNNGAGLVPNTLDSERYEPSGDLIIENNKIFWNNLNYYQGKEKGSPITTVIGNGNPIGAGILLYGTDGVTVRNNEIFGNGKWGVASFSGPELFGVNTGDDAKNMNNKIMNNKMGLNGADPNAIDFFNDNSGGGNCWQDNTAQGGVTFAPGNRSISLETIYPPCPQAKARWVDVLSVDLFAGLQANASLPDFETKAWKDLTTIFGVAEVRPSKLQECAMDVRDHPPYRGLVPFNAERITSEECDELYAREGAPQLPPRN
jgi:hypothetical protein